MNEEKSPAAQAVLRLMDGNYHYKEALHIALLIYPEVNWMDLEQELNYYI